MKTLSQLREAVDPEDRAKAKQRDQQRRQERSQVAHQKQAELEPDEPAVKEARDQYKERNDTFPAVLVLRRRAIRLYPDGQKIGLYFSDKLNRHFSIPSMGVNIGEEVVVEEAKPGKMCNLELCKGIVQNKQRSRIKFLDGSTMTLDPLTAKAVVTVHDSLAKPESKIKFLKMLNKSKDAAGKIVNFAYKHTT